MASEMKDSGIEWIGEIPTNWNITRLCNLIDGYKAGPFGSALIMDRLLDEGEILVYTPENVAESNADLPNNKYLQVERKNEMQQFIVHAGDIIFPIVGSLGRAMYITDNMPTGIINQRLAKFHICSPEIDVDYFLRLFAKSSFYSTYIDLTCRGSIIVNLTKSILHDMPVLLPPISVQKKIAIYLDKKCTEIDALASDIQSQIDILEKYKKSVITEAVTKGLNPDVEMKDSGIEWIGEIPYNWKVLRVKNIGEYRNGLTYSPMDLTDEKEGILVLRSSNVQNGEIVLEDNVYVSCSIRPDLKVKQGDILICSRNGSRDLVGKNAIIRDNIEASFGAFMMIFRCMCPKYMYYILNSAIFSYYLGTFFTSTINQLTGSNFGNMKIVFCDNKMEQDKIVNYLDKKCAKIDASIHEKKQQLEILNQYKKSLIYEYVTGKKEVLVND